MKPKLFLLVILSFIFSAGFSQSTVTVSVNGDKKGECTLKTGQTDGGIVIKKSDCKKIKKLLIQVKGELISSGPYKRTLDITDKAEKTVLNQPETATGEFTITDAKIKALLLKGTPIKLYLLMQPADERLMIPSKHIYMGTLSAK
jgi:type 1 fimbria pilin